jgi:hypothetical protein
MLATARRKLRQVGSTVNVDLTEIRNGHLDELQPAKPLRSAAVTLIGQ